MQVKRTTLVAAVGVLLVLVAFGLWQVVDTQSENTAVVTQPSVGAGAGSSTAPQTGAGQAEAERESAAAPAAGQGAGGESAGAQPESQSTDTASGSAPAQEAQTAALPPQSQAQPDSDAAPAATPSFDVVRVEPGGDAVMAGRAEPGSNVTITSNGETFGTATSDARGEWTFVSKEPLEPGDHEISILAETQDGRTAEADEVVVVSVPEPQVAATDTRPKTPVTVLIPKTGDGPSRVLQAPRGEGISVNDLVLEAIDYDPAGRLIVSGRATVAAQIIVYLDNRPLGGTVADGDGRWSVTSPEALAPGLHELRVDQVDDKGKVIARVQTPISRSELLARLPEDQFFIVQPGNSLWRIARRAYGSGVRYTMIFEANQAQIRNPDLIYPGQIFVLPSQ